MGGGNIYQHCRIQLLTNEDPSAVLINRMPGHSIFDSQLSFSFIQFIDELHFGERTVLSRVTNSVSDEGKMLAPDLIFRGLEVYIFQ